ncbi:nitrate- and nitrite sensing domain-containing protein [Actinoplanes sp. NPDC020271]|uniref:sensor histidine kinase n=1 Tax=Actinoplanes sp. NPDC020271 TaxID=3363896 RepID=UPI00379BB37B
MRFDRFRISRLRIRGKLTLLVIIPLLAMAGLVLPVVRDLVTAANKATAIDEVATVAERVGNLLADMQRERLLSVGYLLGAVTGDDLELQTAAVTDRARDVQRELGSALPDAVRAKIEEISTLATLREKVRARTATTDEVIDEFAPLLDDMIESFRLVQRADPETTAGRQLIALDALLRMDESNTESTALLAGMAAGDVPAHFVRYREERAEYDTYLDRFEGFATAGERQLYDLVAAAFQDRLGKDFDTRFEADPVATMAALPVARLFPALRSFSVLGGFVKKRLADEVATAVTQQRQRQLLIAYVVGALVLLVLLAVLVLVAAVARAVAVPLTQLSRAAERVAEAGETELRRIADDESETVEPVRFEVLDLDSEDEIGDLARVFARVQNTASQLVERQVLSRRNVAEMFGHIGRRTQNLVGGQVGLIDELENDETSPDRLAKLYQLDHIANRLRRSADSLVVISGAEREESHRLPVRLVDVTRLALAEIEEYTRVDVDVPLDLLLAPALVSDMVLICGELLENATTFSPPHTRVSVTARAVPGGARLVVADHGIGMPAERLAEENARIARRERLDLVPTQVLGLFVVGRLARRHGLEVVLSPTAGGGVTVEVRIGGGSVLTSVPEIAPAAPMPSAPRSPAPIFPRASSELTRITPEWIPAAEISFEPRPDVRAAVSRASQALGDQRTWNGFGAPRQVPAPATAPAPAPPSGLRQRVPGAQLPPVTAPALATHVPGIADAEAAKSFVEALEFGVRSAETAAGPPETSPHGLNRRVPGASLPHGETTRRPAAPPAVVHDPDAARLLVEQIEFGVTQALHDTSPSNRQ